MEAGGSAETLASSAMAAAMEVALVTKERRVKLLKDASESFSEWYQEDRCARSAGILVGGFGDGDLRFGDGCGAEAAGRAASALAVEHGGDEEYFAAGSAGDGGVVSVPVFVLAEGGFIEIAHVG